MERQITHLLIDADLMVYKAASSTEFACDWGNDVWVLSANLEQAKQLIRSRLKGMCERFNTELYTLVLSDTENFRVDLNPDYKSDRKATRKPIVWGPLREWMFSDMEAISYPRLEADDTLGILQTSGIHDATIIVSEDKDMQTIPGHLFRGGELVRITLEEANHFHMMQTLMGDPTDGYKGCKGIGPKTAEKLLQGNPEGWWGTILETYSKAGMSEEDALLNARMAYILRAENWDKDKQAVRLWCPPGPFDGHKCNSLAEALQCPRCH